tara:strand:- start:3409 stop:3636 length:228 start_codon:yes stop_codon:yes gene_type:complete
MNQLIFMQCQRLHFEQNSCNRGILAAPVSLTRIIDTVSAVSDFRVLLFQTGFRNRANLADKNLTGCRSFYYVTRH